MKERKKKRIDIEKKGKYRKEWREQKRKETM